MQKLIRVILPVSIFAAVVVFVILWKTQNPASTETEPGFTPNPTLRAVQLTLQHQWLQGELCQPPCWIGIIPGETTAAEAVEILNNFSWAKNIIRRDENVYGEIEWDWIGVDDGGGRIFFDVSRPDHIVEVVIPYITGYFGSYMRVGEIIDSYGEPDLVNVIQLGPSLHGHTIPMSYSVEFIWLSQGFSCESGLGEENTQMDENMLAYTLAFFEPSLDGYLGYRGNAGITHQPWRGFLDVKKYLESQEQNGG